MLAALRVVPTGSDRIDAAMTARILVLASVIFSLPASAEDGLERPWAVGVEPEQQQRALAIFDEGNALFLSSKYSAALGRYRDALSLWDHPGIHYNAAVCLINLDQPLEAYEHLEKALAFGAAPLGDENNAQALLYKKLLSAQLAELHVVCAEPGAQVMLDGSLLFTAPGELTLRLRPGAHQLVARKSGLLTESRALQLPAGQLTREDVKLSAITATPMRSVRRWEVWMPWVVLGGGVLVAAVGVPFAIDAAANMSTFDEEVNRLCASGCNEAELPASVIEARERAETESGIALAALVGGGALAAAGVVLLLMNQPQLVPVEGDKPASGITIQAQATPRGAGLRAALRF
jgi:hypothetical protein